MGATDERPIGPKSFIFMQFLAKISHNNRLAHPPRELVPPLGNPGSTTASCSQIKCFCFCFAEFLPSVLTFLLENRFGDFC